MYMGQEVTSLTEEMEQYLIGQVAQILGLQPQKIRFYESLGIVRPRRLGRLRIYGRDELKVLEIVKYLREIGVPLSSIGKLIKNNRMKPLSLCSAEAKEFLSEHLTRMKSTHSELESQINELSKRLDRA